MAEYVYLNTNENDRASNTVKYKDLNIALQMRERFPLHKYERAAPIMQRLRSLKSPLEVAYIKQGIYI